MKLDVTARARHCEIPLVEGMKAGITLAASGDMALSRAAMLPWRAAFMEQSGIGRGHLYGLRQVHSRRVQLIEEQTAEEAASIEADALLTARADVVLSVTVADCLPVFLADQRTGAFGIVHSGWKGTGIVREALALLTSRFGSRPAEVAALIGPGIGACCYTVQEDRAAFFSSTFGADTVSRDLGGAPRLDLRAANIRLLREAGVEEIGVVTDCTSCTPALGSFRRQGPSRYILMLAWIGPRAALSAG